MRAIAMAADGSFAVTWTSEANNETSSALLGTYVRFFDKDGVPTSAEIQVDTDNRGNQTAASIALLDNGNYIITWSDNNPDPLSPGDAWDVYARIFQPNGTAIGNEFRINGSAEHFALNNQFNSSVATSSNGNFVVTWVTQNQIDANFDPLDPGDGIYARVFNQSGAAVTAEFAVNTTIINNQLKPTVAMADNGSFVIVWESLMQDGSVEGVYGQRFNAAGAKQGGEFQINQTTNRGQRTASVAMAGDGSFVVVWVNDEGTVFGEDVYGRRYDSNGNALGGEFRVANFGSTTALVGNQRDPIVTITQDGGFIVTWTDGNSGAAGDNSGTGVMARRFSSTGLPLEPAFLVNATRVTGDQDSASTATNATGDFIVAWTERSSNGGGDTSGSTILFQGYRIPASAPPTVTPSALLTYTENQGATLLNAGIIVDDPDSDDLVGATISIGGFVAGQDVLNFVNQNGINGTFDAGTGTLTLSGTASEANYQTALRSITYENTSNNPNTSPRTIQFSVNDGSSNGTGQSTIQITATNDLPTVNVTNSPLIFSENGPAVRIDPSLSLTDEDSPNLSGATITVLGFVAGNDTIGFTNQGNISGIVTGNVLTLSGSATIADYQTALQSITFRSTSAAPTPPRRIQFVVNDGSGNSAPDEIEIQIAAIDDPPNVEITAGDITYQEGSNAIDIGLGITVTDVDSPNLTGATVRLAGFVAGQDILTVTLQGGVTGSFVNGDLQLTGNATPEVYQAILQSITYRNSSATPNDSDRTLQIRVNDGNSDSQQRSRTIKIGLLENPPEVTPTTGDLTYVEGDGDVVIDGNIQVADADSGSLLSVAIEITNYVASEDIFTFVDQAGISGSLDTTTGILLLTGTATLEQYQTALRSITYRNNSTSPNITPRILKFTATDSSSTVSTTLAEKRILVNDSLNAPQITFNTTDLTFAENGDPIEFDNALTISDIDSTDLTGATVTINGYVAGQDFLAFTPVGSINGVFADGVLTFTGTASLTDYQAILQSVTYENTSPNPTGATRQIVIRATDGVSLSNQARRTVLIEAFNNAPTLAGAGGSFRYTENAGAVVVVGGLTVTDLDNANLVSATVTIDGYVAGEDSLTFVAEPGITGDYANGVLALTGSATLEAYQTTLRSVRYTNSSTNPTTTPRTIQFVVNDGEKDSAMAERGIDVAANTPPNLAINSDPLSYVENAGAIAIDDQLTLTDSDSPQLTGATVTISSGYITGEDILSVTNQFGITGTFNPTTGVLTLTGAASPGDYETVLRTVSYTNTNATPTASTRTIQFQVNDGIELSTDSRPLQVSNNAAPAVNLVAPPTLSYTENQGAVAIDGGLTVTDTDTPTLIRATVTIDGYVAGEDSIGFTPVAGITGVFDTATGVLNFTGSASLVDYQTLLRSLTYTNSSSNPTATNRNIIIRVNDGIEDSAPAARSIQIQANAAPSISIVGSTLTYTENQGALAIDNALTVTDTDSPNLASATVTIRDYVAGQDSLTFTLQPGISGTFDPATGVLTLTGSASPTSYQEVLQSVSYTNSSANPTGLSRRIEFLVNDGIETSQVASRDIQVNTVNSPPGGSGDDEPINYNENSGGVPVNPGLTLNDPDSDNLTGAIIRIDGFVPGQDILNFLNQNGITGTYDPATGILTLTGTATVAQYEAAIQSITYTNTSNNPTTTPRNIVITVTDGTNTSPEITRPLVIVPVNTAPSVTTTTGNLFYNENAGALAIDTAINVSDPDSANLTGATIAFSNNSYVSGQDLLGFTTQNGISGSFDAATGVLTLSGTTTVANYQLALRSITYTNSSTNPNINNRTLDFSVTDGTTSSGLAPRTIQLTAVNNPPSISTGSGSLSYTEGAGAVAIDSNITVQDDDSLNLVGATVLLNGYVSGQDSLGFVTQNGISGSFNASTGVLTLTGTASVAAYQAALRSITYSNSSDNPSTTTRTLRLTVTDGTAVSNPASRPIQITQTNSAPAVSPTASNLSYLKNSGAVLVDSAIALTDPDSTSLTGATITLTGYVASEDSLSFVPQNGITGSFNPSTGILALSGTSSIANYQVALRSITYSNSSNNPNLNSRGVQFVITDGENSSTPRSRVIQLATFNSPPSLTVTAGPVVFAEQGGAIAIDPGMIVIDVDSQSLTGATVTLNGYVAGQDLLAFTDQNGITSSFNSSTGLLTLSGTASLANYQAALRSVVYLNTSTTPTTTNRTAQFTVTDGAASSNLVSRVIQVISVNDAPTVTIPTQTVNFTRSAGVVAIAPNLTVSDPDGLTLAGATITLGGYVAGQDNLLFSDQNGISGSFNAITGVLTLSGTAAIASYQSALQSILYSNNSENPSASPRAITVSVTDGITSSNPANANIQIQFESSFFVPVLDLNGVGGGTDFSNTFVVSGPAVATSSGDAQFANNNSSSLVSAQVRISNLLDGANEELLVNTDGTGILASYSRESGTLNLSGNAPLASYLQVLRGVQYLNRSDNPDRATRILLFTVNDGTRTSEPAQTAIQITQINLTRTFTTTPATDLFTAPGGGEVTVISTMENLRQNDAIDGNTIRRRQRSVDNGNAFILTDGTGSLQVNVANRNDQVTGIQPGRTFIRNFDRFDLSAFRGTASMLGSEADDDLIGGSGNDELRGLGGGDRLVGNAGNDLLDGGSGDDTLIGGLGDDRYIVDSPNDVILEGVDEGFDRVISSVNWTLGANLEDLELTGNAVNGTGNELGNEISGNAFNNTLQGLDGDDILNGGSGRDRLLGGKGRDSLFGGNGRDRLVGSGGDDLLNGGRGRDRLTGGKGKDAFYLESARRSSRDTITDFRSGQDTIQVSRQGFSLDLLEGAIAPSQLILGSRAVGDRPSFIYDQPTGGLFFDADGAGNASAIWVATLSNKATLRNSDIQIMP
jgi:hypothetical protein